ASIELQAGQIDPALLLNRQANLVDDTQDTRDALTNALGSSPRLISLLHGATGALWAVAFSPVDNHLVAAGGEGAIVQRWTPPTRQVTELKGHEKRVHNLAFSPDGSLLATAGEDRKIHLWSVVDGTENSVLDTGYPGFVHGLAFSPDGNTLAWGG